MLPGPASPRAPLRCLAVSYPDLRCRSHDRCSCSNTQPRTSASVKAQGSVVAHATRPVAGGDQGRDAWQTAYGLLGLSPENDALAYAHVPLARAGRVATSALKVAGKVACSQATGHSTSSAQTPFPPLWGLTPIYPLDLSSDVGKPPWAGSNTLIIKGP